MPADSQGPRSWQRPTRDAGDSRPLVLGHRGASVHETENTLAAFRRAVADGADGVELDVRRCQSGEVVVFHDPDLRRLARRPERIAELPLAALREVRLGGGGAIPTLADVLEATGPATLVNVEIKVDGFAPLACAALVAGVAEVVRRAGATARVLVSSFSPTALWLWHRHRVSPCGLLFEQPRPLRRPWPLRTDILLPVMSVDAVHPAQALCTREAVADWHRRGYAVNAWTADDPGRVQALAQHGVDAIITNDPAAVRSALRLTLRSVDG